MRILRTFNGMSPVQARFAGFIALSIALHLITVIGTGPLALSTARPAGSPARTELHATLVRSDSASRPALSPDAEKPAAASEPASPSSSATGAESPRAEPGVAARGLALPAPDKWYTASEVDVRAEPITDIPLRYPAEIRERILGKVRVRVFIDEGGVVRKLQIAESEPPGVFDEAAKQAWQEVRFSPARRNGVAVKSQKLIELNYAPSGSL